MRTRFFPVCSLVSGGLIASSVSLFSAVTLLSAVSCGGGATPADSPADEEAGKAASGADAGAAPASEAEARPQDEPAAEEAKKEEAPQQTPKMILLREGTLFLLDIENSAMGIKAKEKCESQHKDDVAKRAQCTSKALGKIEREGLTFDEDDEGNWWIIRFAIINNKQIIYNKMQIDVGEPSGSKITIKPFGKDKARGRAPLPKELEFEVPDEFTVVLHDPKRGRLEYEPKLGLLEQSE